MGGLQLGTPRTVAEKEVFSMATRAQRNRFPVEALPELPKRRDAKRDALVDYGLVVVALVAGLIYYFFFA